MDYTIHKLSEHAFMLRHEIDSELYRDTQTRRDVYSKKCIQQAHNLYTTSMIRQSELDSDKYFVQSTRTADTEYLVIRVGSAEESTPPSFRCICNKYLKNFNAPQEAGRTCKHIEAVKFHIFGFEAQPKQLPPGPAILPEVTPEAVRMAALRGLDDLLGELQEATQYTERLKQLFSAGDMAPCLGLISDCKRKAKDIVLSVGGAICQMFHDQVYTQTSLIFFFFSFILLAAGYVQLHSIFNVPSGSFDTEEENTTGPTNGDECDFGGSDIDDDADHCDIDTCDIDTCDNNDSQGDCDDEEDTFGDISPFRPIGLDQHVSPSNEAVVLRLPVDATSDNDSVEMFFSAVSLECAASVPTASVPTASVPTASSWLQTASERLVSRWDFGPVETHHQQSPRHQVQFGRARERRRRLKRASNFVHLGTGDDSSSVLEPLQATLGQHADALRTEPPGPSPVHPPVTRSKRQANFGQVAMPQLQLALRPKRSKRSVLGARSKQS